MNNGKTKKDRTDTSASIVVPGGTELSVPEYLRADGETGLEGLLEFFTPPRLMIVQKNSKSELLSQFAPGDTVVMPLGTLVARARQATKDALTIGDPFFIVPVYFWPEWMVWNDYRLKGKVPPIRERTLDPTSEIAVKAKSPTLREEPHPEFNDKQKNYKLLYVEHLNFLVRILKPPPGVPDVAAISFFRGEHFAGRMLCSLIKMRRAAIYSQVLQLQATMRRRGEWEWFGFNASNPPQDSGVGPWVPETEIEDMRKLYDGFNAQRSMIRVDVEAPDIDNGGTGVESEDSESGGAF